ncbi:hypothetical protein M569_10131, partial [Genlisea aurea]
IPEDLHFVLRMRHTFESLGYQSGFYLSQLFSSNRNASSSSTSTPMIASGMNPPHLFNWTPKTSFPSSSTSRDESHMFIGMLNGEDEGDMKWPSGLSFFNALTGEDKSLLLLSQQ